MKKLNITKERYEKSRYFSKKYGKLEYVSESGDVYKTDKGKVLKFVKESVDRGDWLDENLFDVIRKLDDAANKAMTDLKDHNLSTKLKRVANYLTEMIRENAEGSISKD